MEDTAPAEAIPSSPAAPVPSAPASPPPPVEIEALYDGERRAVHPGVHSAAKEWTRRRKENAEATGITDEVPTDELKYIDGRAPDAEVDAKTAAEDIAKYRAQKAAELLAQMTGEAQPDQQQQPTAEATEQTADPVQQLWDQLPAETKAALEQQTASAREQMAADQQRFVEDWNAAQLARNNYVLGLHALAANARGHNLREFADIQTHADLQRVAQQDPARFQRFQTMNAELGALQTELSRVTAEQQQLQQQQFAQQYSSWAKAQDEAVDRLIPEMRSGDTEALRALQTASREVLNEAGFSDDEMRNAWANGGHFFLRDARVQKVISDAARWRMGQARAKEIAAKAVQPPPVQRPGVSGQRQPHSFDEIEAMRRQLTHSGSLRDAAKLRIAQVAARKRGY